MSEIIKNSLPDTTLTTKDFDYNLPKERIAQHAAEPRDSSRLLVIDRRTGKTEDKIFRDIIDYLRPGDTLVINDSKVIPARLYGWVEGRPEAVAELLLLRTPGGGKRLGVPGQARQAGPGGLHHRAGGRHLSGRRHLHRQIDRLCPEHGTGAVRRRSHEITK